MGTSCAEPKNAVCDVKCEKPECEIKCPDKGCSALDCPRCVTICKQPHCVTHCQAPKVECCACHGTTIGVSPTFPFFKESEPNPQCCSCDGLNKVLGNQNNYRMV